MTGSDPDQIARNASWLAHRFDPGSGKVQFVSIPRARHAEIPFLTDEYLGKDAPRTAAPLSATAGRVSPAPLHFILHSAFCCSTLLARALDRASAAMALSEPVILNDIVGWRHRERAASEQVARVTDQALRLLARPWDTGEAVVVKPSNLLNPMAPGLLQLAPSSRAILLHAPLETYLGSIARKGLEGRLWVRDLLVKLLREGMINLGIEGSDLLKLTDLQVAAVGWLAQHQLFERLATQLPVRIRTLDSDLFLQRPAETIAAAARLFGIPIDDAAAAEIAEGPAFTRNSKSGARFTAEDREAERQRGLALHAEEIGKVRIWAEAVASQFGIPMHLSNPLLPR